MMAISVNPPQVSPWRLQKREGGRGGGGGDGGGREREAARGGKLRKDREGWETKERQSGVGN